MCSDLFVLLQHKLKSSQRDKVKKFIAFTQTGEKTAIFCLSQNDWKLDLASDNYFQNPDLYFREPKISVDKKKLEQLFTRYRGSVTKTYVFYIVLHFLLGDILIFGVLYIVHILAGRSLEGLGFAPSVEPIRVGIFT
jgi:hypothetical protein